MYLLWFTPQNRNSWMEMLYGFSSYIVFASFQSVCLLEKKKKTRIEIWKITFQKHST